MSAYYLADGIWAKARALLVGYWPNLASQLIEEDGSDTDTAALWRAEFAPFGLEDLMAGIREMAQRIGDGFPSLPVLLPYLRAAKSHRRQSLPSIAAPQYVAVEQWENEKIDELRTFAKNYPGTWTEYEIEERTARIRSEGPFYRRIRGIQEGTDTRTVDEWWREEFSDTERGKGPQSLGEILGRPAKPEPTLEDAARAIAAEYRANPVDWPRERIEALADDVRAAVRDLLAVKA